MARRINTKQKIKKFLKKETVAVIRVSFLITVLFLLWATDSIMSHNKALEKQQEVVELPGHYLGEFSISHYCSCPICTGTPKGSRTATGHIPREGRTVAVDPKLIPLHSVIYVEGLGTFVAEDIGGGVKGKHLDVYIDDHQKALNLGTLKGAKKKVYILK